MFDPLAALDTWCVRLQHRVPAAAASVWRWFKRHWLGAALWLLVLGLAAVAVYSAACSSSSIGAAESGQLQGVAGHSSLPREEQRDDWSRLTSDRRRSGLPVVLGAMAAVIVLLVAWAAISERPRGRSPRTSPTR
jgi:hypothetical protein